jgi:hypothetical protein
VFSVVPNPKETAIDTAKTRSRLPLF